MKSPAIVSYPAKGKIDWRFETIDVRETLEDHEVLVEMLALGLCHSDILLATTQTDDVRILGHEGAGVVKKIGKAVSNCAVGDQVALSYTYCGDCKACKRNEMPYCSKFLEMNIANKDEPQVFRTTADTKLLGKFFGQSSFSKYLVVNDTSVVNVAKYNLSAEQLAHSSPLGCGLQTGAGAILIAGRAKKGDSAIVYGCGGVGFAGIMAAKIAGCYPIIAIDILPAKLETAKLVGATHTFLGGDDADIHEKLMELTDGGVDVSLDTLGGPHHLGNAINNAGPGGRVLVVGVKDFSDVVEIPSTPFMAAGKQLIGCTEGSAVHTEFVPKMLEWYLEGKFPLDKIVRQYPVEDFETALADMKSGKTVKAVFRYDWTK